MILQRSIRFRLSLVFFFFLFLVLILGLFSIACLKQFNIVSSDIRDRWLQDTRYLGDLNNYTSDFRAAEATHLLSSNSGQLVASELEMKNIDHAIQMARQGYGQVYHDPSEDAIYRRFSANWDDYRQIAEKVLRLSREGRKAEGITLYMTASRDAYEAASDTLGLLTEHNVAEAREASERSGASYSDARVLIETAILLAGLMVVIAIWYIRRSLSNPLLQIAGAMRRLAVNETNIEISGTKRQDEIGEMARAVVVFRNNAIDLALSRHGLAQQASMLAEKLEQEQHLTALQRNFVMMASHEFRTPLGVIDGHAQRMVKTSDRLQAEDIVERAGRIRSAVLQMTSLIEKLLNASRLFDGDASLYFHPAEMDMAKLLHDVCVMHREITPEAQIEEQIEALPSVQGDSKLLYQVFSNLLSNAVKYSPDGGTIKLAATGQGEHIAVSVEDQGMGIPEADVARLFERYYRGGNVRSITGTGLGLYLARMVLQLHGGSISVTSSEGNGSRFTVTLPCANPAVSSEGEA